MSKWILGAVAACTVLAACQTTTAEWQSVSSAATRATLIDRTVVWAGDRQTGQRQTWNADGTTVTQSRTGEWRVQGREYCSRFENEGWRCYGFAVSADGTRIRFDGGGDFVWVGEFVAS